MCEEQNDRKTEKSVYDKTGEKIWHKTAKVNVTFVNLRYLKEDLQQDCSSELSRQSWLPSQTNDCGIQTPVSLQEKDICVHTEIQPRNLLHTDTVYLLFCSYQGERVGEGSANPLDVFVQ